jgi:hypothetical protein
MLKVKRIGGLALCLIILLTACSKPEIREFVVPGTMQSIESGVISQNDRYSLEWDNETKCVLLKARRSGHVWSTTPYDYYLQGETSYSLSSPLVIEYYDKTDGSIQMSRAYECIEEGLVSVRMDGQKLRNAFYFQDAEITITVTYELREDSLLISLNTSDFEETGKTKLISVSVAPYLCSVANTQERSSYLFVPSGSGGLMYVDEQLDDMTREFSGEVYGHDPACKRLDNPGREEPIRLPVFGVKSGSNALFAIIERGDGAARVNALAGNPRNGYSTVYATFYVRGYNNAEWDTRKEIQGSVLYKDVVLLSEKWPEDKEFAVGYYPLVGEGADYNGMAACYREYLQKTGKIEKSGLVQQPYHVAIVGGAQVEKFTLGIPHKAFLPLTTFKQAQQMLDELIKLTGHVPEIILRGFGKSGMDVGQIAGGFGFASSLGGIKKHRELEDFCKSNGIQMFTDFDIVQFTSSGEGFYPTFDTARSSDSRLVAYYPLKLNVRVDNTEKDIVRILQRSKLDKAAEKLLKFCNNRVLGVGLSTFGRTAYSDYSEEQYALKEGVSEQGQAILRKFKEAGHLISLSAANGYVAGIADSLFEVPLQNGDYDALDETVPFYEVVFRGTVPLYSTAINLSPNAETQILRAVEAGVSPSFMLSWSLDNALADSTPPVYYGILYESNKSMIEDVVKLTKEFLNKISGAKIQSHRILGEGITQTVFSNGVTVTVNHSEKDVTLDDGRKIKARSFEY